MIGSEYVKMLVEEMHSSAVATIGNDGHPQIRIIDMMYYDDNGVYFLTAQGKEFHRQLMEQKYITLSAIKGPYPYVAQSETCTMRSWICCLKEIRT